MDGSKTTSSAPFEHEIHNIKKNIITCVLIFEGVRLQSATADGMSLPICALYGSPLMWLYTVMVAIAPLILAQYFQDFHPQGVLLKL